jgi:hypothetical protein
MLEVAFMLADTLFSLSSKKLSSDQASFHLQTVELLNRTQPFLLSIKCAGIDLV